VLISFCLGKRLKRYDAFRMGFVWSIGHSLSVFIYGMTLYCVKLSIPASYLEEFSAFVGKLVGLSLVLVGLYGLHEIKEERAHKETKPNQEAIFVTGVVQGFSGLDACLGLLPSLSAHSLLSILQYILLLVIGTIFAVCVFCVALGELNQKFTNRDPTGELPLVLSTYACYLSIIVGVIMSVMEFSGYT